MVIHGDDLNDDFVPDDLVALSEEEVEPADREYDSSSTPGEERGQAPETSSSAQIDQAASEKKRKRKEKLKERKVKKRKLAASTDPPDETALAAQPPPELASYLASAQAKAFPKLSALELSDVRVPESALADTTAWSGARDLDQLPDFIAKVVPALRLRLGQKPKHTGAPTLLFVTGAALRAADATRFLKAKSLRGDKGGEVAKLFAKHFKLEEQAAYLRRTRVAAASGTPGRIGKILCDTEALSTTALTHIILDVSHRDTKNRTLLSIPETRDEVFRTVLGAPKVLKGIRDGKIQVVLF